MAAAYRVSPPEAKELTRGQTLFLKAKQDADSSLSCLCHPLDSERGSRLPRHTHSHQRKFLQAPSLRTPTWPKLQFPGQPWGTVRHLHLAGFCQQGLGSVLFGPGCLSYCLCTSKTCPLKVLVKLRLPGKATHHTYCQPLTKPFLSLQRFNCLYRKGFQKQVCKGESNSCD